MENLQQFLYQSNLIENEPSPQALEDSQKAWEYIIQYPTLNIERLLHMHKILMNTRTTIEDEWKGKFRNDNVTIAGRLGAPPSLIEPMIDELLARMDVLVGNRNLEPKEIFEFLIIKQHVRYEKVHPFFDGNGRTGRILLNYQRVKMGLPILVIPNSNKYQYYEWFAD